MNETWLAILLLLLGWAVSLISSLFNDWLQNRRETRKYRMGREEEIRKRLICTALNFYRAKLDGADLNGTNLAGADLSKASLVDAKLYGAKLQKANLLRANLSEA